MIARGITVHNRTSGRSDTAVSYPPLAYSHRQGNRQRLETETRPLCRRPSHRRRPAASRQPCRPLVCARARPGKRQRNLRRPFSLAAQPRAGQGLPDHLGDVCRQPQLILDRARLAADQAARLPSLAGTGTAAGNLARAAASVLQSSAFATASLVLLRPTLMARMQQLAGATPTALDDIEKAFAAYVDAEQKLGRISGGTRAAGI
jgi:hypothetical protein